jgi:hypothetical protein
VLVVGALGWFVWHQHGGSSKASQVAGSTGGPGVTFVQPTNVDTQITDDPTVVAPSANQDDEYNELSSVESILNSSVSSRSELHQALQTVCDNPAAALSDMEDVANQRNDEISQAQALDLSAISNGSTLGADLVAFLQASAKADDAYETYVQAINSAGCSSGKSAFARGNTLSTDAQSAKAVFFEVWTPLANQFGLTTHDTSDV